VVAGSNLASVALGVLLIGPTTFLPTYAQTVLGYGAVAAGFVLASMSIGWPVASALCSRLYLRIGFRDTALIGAFLALVGVAVFLPLPFAPPVWTVVASTLVLGAGLGLISTPLVVGVQSSVAHEQRGVATGSLMFCRFLGQSLGAAVFGAVVNGTLAGRLAAAPAGLRPALPSGVDGIEPAIEGRRVGGAALGYLREALDAATHHLYAALTVAGVLAAVVLLVAPRRFPITGQGGVAGGPAAAEPVRAAPAEAPGAA
jgi:MFS family permease